MADTTTTAAPVATTSTVTTAPPAGTTTLGPTTAGLGDLDEGPHLGYLTGVRDGTVEGQSVQIVGFDKVELLTGEEAVEAARDAGDIGPDDTAVDNDYYIVNDNPLVRDLPVIPDGQVWVLENDGGSPDLRPGSVDEAVAIPTLYEIEVVVVRGVSLVTGISGYFLP